MKRKLLPTKKLLLTGIVSGGVFAVLMAGYDYSVGESFSLTKFFFHFIILGGIMAFVNRYNNNVTKY